MYEHAYHTEDLGGSAFLITGGAGFIGSNIAEYLVKYRAGKVRVLDNFATGHSGNLKALLDYPGFELIEGDIRDMETCRRACEGMDFVSHQAALGSVPRSIKDPLTTNEVNIGGFLNILTAARDAGGIKRLVYAASSSTYGDSPALPKVEDQIGNPLSPYAVTKYVNELYGGVFSRVYGFHTIGLRYFNVFGPRQDPDGPYAAVIPNFMRAATRGEAPFINGDGEQTRDFTFVENAVQANIRALFNQGVREHEVFNIACGERISLNELWRSIAGFAGVTTAPLYHPPRQGDIRDSLADIGKAGRVLGYWPGFAVRKGLEITFAYYLNNR